MMGRLVVSLYRNTSFLLCICLLDGQMANGQKSPSSKLNYSSKRIKISPSRLLRDFSALLE